MGPLENLTGKVVAFIEAAGQVEWPLPLARPAAGTSLTPARAKSAALNPAEFGIRATAQHDGRFITAYCLDLPGTLALDLEAVDATEDEISEYLQGVLAFLSHRFGEPTCVRSRNESTSYSWWSLPEAVRLHVVATAPTVAHLWITRLCPPAPSAGPSTSGAAAKVPTAAAGLTAPRTPSGVVALESAEALSALAQWIVGDNWAVNLNALLYSAADAGWVRLSGSYERFFLAGGGEPGAVSHPDGQPLLSVICEPPYVTISEPAPGQRLLSVELPRGVAQGDPLGVLARLYGAPSITERAVDWRCEWRVNDRLLALTNVGGSMVLSVLDDHAIRKETLDEDKVLRYLNTLVEDLTSVEQGVDAAFVAQLADRFSWVRVDTLVHHREHTTELYAPRTGPWGVPGAVVHYKYGLVEQVFVQGVPQRRTNDGRAQLEQMRERLLGVFAAKYGQSAVCESQEIPGSDRGEKGTYISRWFHARNRKSVVAILMRPDELPISVAYPLSNTPDTWGAGQENCMLDLAEHAPEQFKELQREIKPLPGGDELPDGVKHFLILAGVLLLAVFVRLFW